MFNSSILFELALLVWRIKFQMPFVWLILSGYQQLLKTFDLVCVATKVIYTQNHSTSTRLEMWLVDYRFVQQMTICFLWMTELSNLLAFWAVTTKSRLDLSNTFSPSPKPDLYTHIYHHAMSVLAFRNRSKMYPIKLNRIKIVHF